MFNPDPYGHAGLCMKQQMAYVNNDAMKQEIKERMEDEALDKPGGVFGPYPSIEGAQDAFLRAKECRAAKDRQAGGDHYLKMGIQPWDVIDTWPREQRIGAYRAMALKHLMRMGNKDGNGLLQEAEKGSHYAQKLVETLR